MAKKQVYTFVNRYKPLQFQKNKQAKAKNLRFAGHMKRHGRPPV